MTDTALLKLFARCGEVSKASIIKDKMTDRSKGFGFILMEGEVAAQKAVAHLDGREITSDGRLFNDDDDNNEVAPVLKLIEYTTKELAKIVAENAKALRDLEWRDLERLLGEVFDGIGFKVELTRSSKDGGKDLVLEFVAGDVISKYYVEVKHWTSGKLVGPNIVRDFLSVIVRDNCAGGLLIATEGFSSNMAETITEIDRRQLILGDKTTVTSLCRTYLNISQGLWKPADFSQIFIDHGMKSGEPKLTGEF